LVLVFSVNRILITGGTGFVGKHLIRSLYTTNVIYVIKRKESELVLPDKIKSKIYVSNIEESRIEEIIKNNKIDIIINLVTCYGRSGEALSEIKEINESQPTKLLDNAISSHVGLFINADTMLSSDRSFYAKTKNNFREVMRLKNEIKIANLKFEHIYGEGDTNVKFIEFLLESFETKKDKLNLSEGSQERDFIYIEDVISAIEKIIHEKKIIGSGYNEFEVGTGESISIKNMINILKEEYEKVNGKIETEIIFSKKVRSEDTSCYVDNTKLRELGWKPKYKIREGFARYINKR